MSRNMNVIFGIEKRGRGTRGRVTIVAVSCTAHTMSTAGVAARQLMTRRTEKICYRLLSRDLGTVIAKYRSRGERADLDLHELPKSGA
jgi:hypothetical protein